MVKRRFFSRCFFALCDEILWCSSRRLGIQRGEVQLAQPDGSAHAPMAKGGDAPAARPGDLRDQAVDVKAVEEATNLGTLLGRVLTPLCQRAPGCSGGTP